MLAIVFASFALVVVLWETARVPTVIGLAIAYIAGFGGAVWAFRRFLARQPKPFAATLSELQQDRECIRPES
jgi:uncharacterized membrane protein YqjE